MPIDTFFVFVGTYADLASAEADYAAVKTLHTEAELIDAYDAAVVHRRDDGKVKIVRHHETPTRVGGVLGGGIGLFPAAAIGTGLLAGATAGGAALGAVAGHATAGLSRKDLKVLGEQLDRGSAGLVVVGVSDMESKIEAEMTKAENIERRELQADTDELGKAVGSD
jgi:uncharacterized membrane protein